MSYNKSSLPSDSSDLSSSGHINQETFDQLLELDEDDTHDFSKGMAWAYFDQARSTFEDMNNALYAS